MTYAVRLSVAPGTGRLLRGSHFVLFVPVDDSSSELLSSVSGAAQGAAADVVIDVVLAHPEETPAFVFVEWPDDDVGQIRIMVRGGASVTTDIASVPELSGASSSTWAEHRVPRTPASARLHAGERAPDDTELTNGIVPSGGFALTMSNAARVESDQPASLGEAPADETPDAEPEITGLTGAVDTELIVADIEPAVATVPDPASVTPLPEESPAVPSTNAAPISPLDALLSADDSDWMEESLQLDRAPTTAPSPISPPAPAVEPPTVPPTPDRLEAAPLPRQRPPGPPAYPGDSPRPAVVAEPAATDSDVTLSEYVPHRPADEPGDGTEPVVQARLCPSGHPNSPQSSSCRRCGVTVDTVADTVTVDQPTLGEIVLPDGTRHPLRGATVLGRRPSRNDARLDQHTNRTVDLVALDAPASVSRTHAVVIVDGWQLFATDCGSSGGTALVAAGADHLVALDSWIAHELEHGDRLYLGGPTVVEIHDVARSALG